MGSFPRWEMKSSLGGGSGNGHEEAHLRLEEPCGSRMGQLGEDLGCGPPLLWAERVSSAKPSLLGVSNPQPGSSNTLQPEKPEHRGLVLGQGAGSAFLRPELL